MITVDWEQFCARIGAVSYFDAFPKEAAELMAKLSQEVADQIDKQILDDLRAKSK